jgi:hypothetical protein
MGYSQLMGADEEGTHERPKAHRRGAKLASADDIALLVPQRIEAEGTR